MKFARKSHESRFSQASILQTFHLDSRGFFTIFFNHFREINHLFCVAFNYVQKIVAENIVEFEEWLKVYSQRDKILQLKNSLLSIMDQCPHLMDMDIAKRNKMMNVAINQLVQDIKQKPAEEINIESAVQQFVQINHSILVEAKH